MNATALSSLSPADLSLSNSWRSLNEKTVFLQIPVSNFSHVKFQKKPHNHLHHNQWRTF